MIKIVSSTAKTIKLDKLIIIVQFFFVSNVLLLYWIWTTHSYLRVHSFIDLFFFFFLKFLNRKFRAEHKKAHLFKHTGNYWSFLKNVFKWTEWHPFDLFARFEPSQMPVLRQGFLEVIWKWIFFLLIAKWLLKFNDHQRPGQPLLSKILFQGTKGILNQ